MFNDKLLKVLDEEVAKEKAKKKKKPLELKKEKSLNFNNTHMLSLLSILLREKHPCPHLKLLLLLLSKKLLNT